jgi:general secretion pathway protein K
VARESTTFYLARAGVVRAVREVNADTNGWDSLGEAWSVDPVFAGMALPDGVVVVGSVGENGAVTNAGLVDEERKININKAGVPVLASLIELAGEVEAATAAGIAACIVDWRDPDDNVLPNGAENAYYQSLSVPYSCRNDSFQLPEELRLVRGVTPDLMRRIRSRVTVHGEGRVNINTADSLVLTSIALSVGTADRSVCDELVGKMLACREVSPFTSRERMAGAIPGLAADETTLLQRMISTGILDVSSCFFGGTVWGIVPGRGVEPKRIDFVFGRANGRMESWHED